MRIRAVSVFEGVVYHCWPVDTATPCRPQLEVEALLRPGDADATAGPLLLTVADYIAMVGDLDTARPCLEDLAAQGRIVERLGADHIAFPTWTRIDGDAPGGAGTVDPGPPDGPAPERTDDAAGPVPDHDVPRPRFGVVDGGRPDHDPPTGDGGVGGRPR